MLTELRDKIHCLTDHVMEKAGTYDPSGYFLIEVRISSVHLLFFLTTKQVLFLLLWFDRMFFFFCLFKDVFHNDLRNSSATDYSKPILEWLWNSNDEALKKWESILTGDSLQKQKAVLGEAKPKDLPRFVSADMHSTRFCDLRFRLGASYLYCHQVRHPFFFYLLL